MATRYPTTSEIESEMASMPGLGAMQAINRIRQRDVIRERLEHPTDYCWASRINSMQWPYKNEGPYGGLPSHDEIDQREYLARLTALALRS